MNQFIDDLKILANRLPVGASLEQMHYYLNEAPHLIKLLSPFVVSRIFTYDNKKKDDPSALSLYIEISGKTLVIGDLTTVITISQHQASFNPPLTRDALIIIINQ